MKRIIEWFKKRNVIFKIIIIALLIFIGSAVIMGVYEAITMTDEEREELITKQKAEKEAKEKEKKEREAKQKAEKEAKEKEKKKAGGKAKRTITEALEEDNENVDKATLKDGELTLIGEGKTTFSENTLFLSVYDMFEAMHEGFKDKNVDVVYVELTTTMIDQKGNESVEPVIKYNYSRKSFEELNYDNFANMAYGQQWRILQEADYYYIHPGIYKNLKDKYKENLKVEGFKGTN